MFLRVQWEPFESKFGDLLTTFRGHLELLSLSSQSQQLKKLNRLVVIAEKNELEKEIDERRKFLEWISNIDYEKDFDETIKPRHPQTGTWILKHKHFRSWIESPESRLLWCFGKRKSSFPYYMY